MKILLVEDDLEISKLLAEFLQENGYEVFCQYDGLHVLDCLRENNIDLILLDIMLPYRNGDTVLTAVRECLLILMSSILALILGQEFSYRTVDLEITAGHSRKSIFISKVITYLIAFNVMALVYPIAGCIREFFRFGFIDGGNFIYQATKAVLYSLLLNSATFFIAIWICFSLRNSAKAIAVTAVTTFVLSLYLGFGMMLKFPVAFLPTYQIREAVTSIAIFQPFPILIGIVWVVALLILSWCSFRKCELK